MAMRSEFDISALASDRNDDTPSGWQTGDVVPRAQLKIGPFGARGLRRLLHDTPHDLLMLNSFHDPQFVIPILVWRKLGLIPQKPTLLSPRGEFAQGALSLKARKKRIYRQAVRQAGLTTTIWFHATAEHEQHDIESTGLSCRGILLAPNIRLLPDLPYAKKTADPGPLQIAFLGRLAPVKNLDFALNALAEVSAPVVFNIYGPKVDHRHWVQLQALIAQMPDHISVIVHGILPHNQVSRTLAQHDLFFLPTLGENFGHAINEALSAGLPVLISDKTPWRNLVQKGAGWDLPLSEPERFSAVIETFARASAQERSAYRHRARALAEQSFAESDALEANRRMLRHVLENDEDRV